MTTVIEGQRSTPRPGRPLRTGPDEPIPAVVIRGGSAADAPAVMTMVSRCSPETLFHRFHGPARAAELTRAHLDQVGMTVRLAWAGRRCVGVGVLGLDDAGAGHLGVLVEDAWQRRGVGTRVTWALVAGARDQGVGRLHADVLVEDSFLLPLLRRVGVVTVSTSTGAHSVDIFPAPTTQCGRS